MRINILSQTTQLELICSEAQLTDHQYAIVLAALEEIKPIPAAPMCHLTPTSVNPNKIQAIKAVRTITGLGLKESKDVVEGSLPKILYSSTRGGCEFQAGYLKDAGCGYEISESP